MNSRVMNALLRRLRAALLVGTGRRSQLQTYVTAAPSPQTMLDLFDGEWTMTMPGEHGRLRAGSVPLSADQVLRWGIGELDVRGARVLELGPLEGGHSYMLEQAGAADITAIEAHPRAFLRCLIVKELAGLTRTHFLCGNFSEYLRAPAKDERFDIGIASGVLYHMTDPVEILANLAAICDRLYVWTHYHDAAKVAANRALDGRIRGSAEHTAAGFRHTRWRQEYLASSFRTTFCGGSQAFSHWLSREDLLGALAHVGFDDVRVGWEEPDHVNGPAIALVARRTRAS